MHGTCFGSRASAKLKMTFKLGEVCNLKSTWPLNAKFILYHTGISVLFNEQSGIEVVLNVLADAKTEILNMRSLES